MHLTFETDEHSMSSGDTLIASAIRGEINIWQIFPVTVRPPDNIPFGIGGVNVKIYNFAVGNLYIERAYGFHR